MRASASRRSARGRSAVARQCPDCRRRDALRIETDRTAKISVNTCRFCGFTETKGRGIL